MRYSSLEALVADTFEAMRPVEHLTVSEAAGRYHIVRVPGMHNGPWSRDKTPYIVEPQDALTSLDYSSMIFVGPARTGKSAMLINWLTHTTICDPADMMVVHMAQHTARDWVKADLDRAVRNSPELACRISSSRNDDNLYDKAWRSGMRLSITWPTAKNLSGKTVPRQWLMDYDRMADDVDGEGSPFDLTRKRGGTFGRYAMTAAEASPGREVTNPRWIPRTPHEAPPTTGILGLYNLGDRRRWYWACPDCREAFEPDFHLLKWPEHEDISEAAAGVYMPCPHCGSVLRPDQKDDLNRGGRWVKDGAVWRPTDGSIEARPGMRIAGGRSATFWLKGPAAAYQSWEDLVARYLEAERVYAETLDETKLRTTTNTDQGLPYIAKARLSERGPEEMRAMAEDWGSTKEDPTVPPGVRFLIATVDVQARSFVVQVHGFSEFGDMFVIDGFKLRISSRPDGDGRFLPMEPPIYSEDWDLLTDAVMRRSYSLGDGSGRRMPILLTGCDSGGKDGATTQAYNYWRRLRAKHDGSHRKFVLLKGNPIPGSPRAYVTWPDSNQTGKKAVARGDIPLLLLNSLLLKDQLAGMVSRRIGQDRPSDEQAVAKLGLIRYPTWFEDWFFTQMTNEVRLAKGWENPAGRRNEAWDLAYYALGIAVRPYDPLAPWQAVEIEKLNWAAPPTWATDWGTNPDILVLTPEGGTERAMKKFDAARDAKDRFRRLGENLA